MESKKRIRFLDLLRGVAVILMVLFHCLYTFGAILRFDFFESGYRALQQIAPPIISVIFILTCAYSCSLSRNNIKRGSVIFGVALGLSLVTIFILPLLGMGMQGIYFGILHFLGIAVLLSPLIFRLIQKIPWYIGIPVLILLAIGTRDLMFRGFFGIPVTDPFERVNLLFPFGIYHGRFYSADYYPIFPWIFVFAVGCYLPILFPKEKLPQALYHKFCSPIEFIGRHALIVYVIHQPIIYGVGELIAITAKLFAASI